MVIYCGAISKVDSIKEKNRHRLIALDMLQVTIVLMWIRNAKKLGGGTVYFLVAKNKWVYLGAAAEGSISAW